ncbi:hypothetical protein ACFFX0_02795 [Citricoccus parietis]|uniref:Uncharacterized protein n=1 Tax=Citricoccus parietis TaxID=592307 RepID=A0ABV5FUP7_9MICC
MSSAPTRPSPGVSRPCRFSSCAATRARSMAPRTELPWRVSSCSRVARVRATASVTNAEASRAGTSWPPSGPKPVRNATIRCSAAASWYPRTRRLNRSCTEVDRRVVPTLS